MIMKSISDCDRRLSECIRGCNVNVMRLFSVLVLIFITIESWNAMLAHEIAWKPADIMAWCFCAFHAAFAFLRHTPSASGDTLSTHSGFLQGTLTDYCNILFMKCGCTLRFISHRNNLCIYQNIHLYILLSKRVFNKIKMEIILN